MKTLEITSETVKLELTKGLSQLKLGRKKDGSPFGHLEVIAIGSRFGSETVTDTDGHDRKVTMSIMESLLPSTPSFIVLWSLLDCDNLQPSKTVTKAVNATTAKELDISVKREYPSEYGKACKSHPAPTGASALKGI